MTMGEGEDENITLLLDHEWITWQMRPNVSLGSIECNPLKLFLKTSYDFSGILSFVDQSCQSKGL